MATGSKYYWQSKKNGIFEQGDYPMMLTRDPRWGYGLCGGGGFSVLFGRFEAAFEARYYLGYSDVLRNGTKYTGNPNHSPLDNINLSLAVYYRLGKGGHTLGAEQGRRPAYAGGRSAAGSKKARARNGPAGDGYASSSSFRPGRQRFSRAPSSGRSGRFRSRKITIKTDLK